MTEKQIINILKEEVALKGGSGRIWNAILDEITQTKKTVKKNTGFFTYRYIPFMACLISLIAVVSISVYNLMPTKKVINNSNSLIVLKSKSELIIDSDIIVNGKVKEILPSKWSNPEMIKGDNIRNILTTDIVVEVSKVLKGTPSNDKSVIVRIEKGYDTDTQVISDGYPDFEVGEKVILFLSKDDSDIADNTSDYYVLTGMCQGKFELLSVEGIKNEEYVSSANWLKEKISTSSFESDIENIIEENKKNPKRHLTKEEIKTNNEKVIGKDLE
ncbi:MAG: hypothetical protein BWY74_00129 [Firmicutes bacterium ADurb.Bin419]|nr:MAG: hypothetical protein BWY74_00129 [Firmicutes bacterium ADurb.Bin419]